VSLTYELDMSRLSNYNKHGVPDMKVNVTFRPLGMDFVRVHVDLHRRAIQKVSPVFNRWVKASGNSLEDDQFLGKPIDFEKFLDFIYSGTLTPDTLIRIFGFVLKFEVSLMFL